MKTDISLFKEVNYYHVITNKGLAPDPKKTEAAVSSNYQRRFGSGSKNDGNGITPVSYTHLRSLLGAVTELSQYNSCSMTP